MTSWPQHAGPYSVAPASPLRGAAVVTCTSGPGTRGTGQGPNRRPDLSDSVYGSLYKGLGGPAGAVLAGPEDFIADARRSPPHTNTFRIFLAAPAAGLNLAVVTHAETTGEWSFPP